MARKRYDQPTFRPRARLILLLGDQLIRDAGIAVFELVKNAYDADASRCDITLQNVDKDDESPRIIVEDDGHGMDIDTVLTVWLEPGTEHRREQREKDQRSKRFKRLPLGEKGVGRFAVHKLGREVRLVSRRAGSREVLVEIDWRNFEKARYLSDVPIDVRERAPEVFTGRKTGTRIEILDLRDRPWTRRRVRSLHRAITSICSPFGGPDHFTPRLVLKPKSDSLSGLLRPDEVLAEALFRFRGKIEGDTLSYKYEFTPRRKLEGVEKRSVQDQAMPVRLPIRDPETRKKSTVPINLDKHKIGSVAFDFLIFDLDPMVLKLTSTDRLGLRDYLDNNGGVRIYRDGVRVYDFGEPGNDWLELGGRRVNVPVRRISNNQIIGAVLLDLDSSGDLIEKTNREGFVENEAYEALRRAVEFAIVQAEAERNKDKQRIRKFYSRGKKREPVLEDLTSLREEVERRDLGDSLGPYLDRIESQYREVLDRLLVAASAGLNLAAVLHEVEKGIHELHKAIDRGAERSRLVELAKRLSDMVDGLTWLTKRTGKSKVSASTLIQQTIFNSEYRFRGHGIEITDGIDVGDPGFTVHCSRRLIMAALMNLIDNAIYWLDNKGARDKQIYIGTTYEMNGLPAIVVADNGPGFVDPAEYVVQPFFTRKPDGIGLGLHIADEVMKSHNGRLLFPEPDDLTLPKEFRGAVILLEFGGMR